MSALLIGIAGRVGWVDTPAQLSDTTTLVVLAIFTLIEFIADKVPWLDSIWDVAHLFIRPAGAGALSGWMATQGDSSELLVAVAGGAFALSAHAAKSSTRAFANTSPEPVSNVVLSLSEDAMAIAGIAFAIAFPIAAGIIASVFAILCVLVTAVLYRLVKRAKRSRQAKRAQRTG